MADLLSGNLLVRSSLWLRKHPLVTVGLILLYTAFILLMHNTMVNVSVAVMQNLGLALYNKVVMGVMIATAVFGGGWVVWNLWKHEEHRFVKLFFLIASVGWFAIHAITMFEMNIEIIHAAQYAVAAFLMYSLTGRAGAALVFTLPIMLLDEWYQMKVLYPDYVEYLELNDVVLDLLGAGTASILLWIAGVPTIRKPIQARTELYTLTAMAAVVGLLIATCTVVYYPAEVCENTWLVLNNLKDPLATWQIHPLTQAEYHVLTPPEAFMVILGVVGFYGLSDEWH